MNQHEPKSSRALWVLFIFVVLFAAGQLTRSWQASLLDRYEFRQLQTALSTYWIAQDGWQLAYPTPLFGPPWSIPMEFPTYQIIVATLHNATHMPLEQSGRLISVLMLFACLPALHDLLAVTHLSHSRRLIVHSLILTAPVYLFYGRVFMIETTALALGVWFLALLRRTVVRPTVVGILATAVIGVLAALTKITTFIVFGLPAAVLCIHAWRTQTTLKAQARLRLVLAAMIPAACALGVAWWWVHFSDGIKDSNPFSGFLTSRELKSWNFGTWSLRTDWSFWLHLQETIVSHNLAEGAAAVALLTFPFASSRSRWVAGVALAAFLTGPLVFANLYHLHDYYYAANALFLVGAAGVLLASAWDNQHLPRGTNWLALILVLSCQGYAYYRGYDSHHRNHAPAPPAIATTIRESVPVDGVVLIYGADWNPLLPYYIERRVVMVPGERERETLVLSDIVAKLEQESPKAVPFAAMVVHGDRLRADAAFIRDRAAQLGFSDTPAASDADNTLFLPSTQPPSPFPTDLKVESLPPETIGLFNPKPAVAKSRYGLSSATIDGQTILNAHAPSELIFEVPSGARTLIAIAGLPDAAVASGQAAVSDGITLEALLENTDGTTKMLSTHFINPAQNPADRGPQTIAIPLPAGCSGRIILRLGNGPSGNPANDWAYWQSVVIK